MNAILILARITERVWISMGFTIVLARSVSRGITAKRTLTNVQRHSVKMALLVWMGLTTLPASADQDIRVLFATMR